MIHSNNINRPRRRKGFHSNYTDDASTKMFDFVSRYHDSYSISSDGDSFITYGEPNIRGGIKLQYKNYTSIIQWCDEDRCYRGKLENVGGVLVTWESDTYENCEKEFHEAVDDYIEFFRELVENLSCSV